MRLRHFILPVLILSACGGETPDAYGLIDAKSIMVASSESGQIIRMDLREGDRVFKDSLALQIDTAQLSLRLVAVEAQIQALLPTLPNAGKQLDVLESEKKALLSERERVEPLVQSGTASRKQLDAIDDKVHAADSRIAAAKSSLSREKAAVMAQISSLRSEQDILRDKIRRCTVLCPENGLVSEIYSSRHEFVAAGMPIFRLSDFDHLYVDAWFDGASLAGLAPGDQVKVKVDNAFGKLREVPGTVSFISDEAEFTPNRVLTRDTRLTMVYHVRIDLSDASGMRPGMPAEIYK
ncbi:MAG: HlyD family efflux transporter periplasmic adaptor subunit [Bacteroidales bacterium]|nr:HlyD family efflux transporter periplasmic adaptor subunit [Bacteroidales bacterium]